MKTNMMSSKRISKTKNGLRVFVQVIVSTLAILLLLTGCVKTNPSSEKDQKEEIAVVQNEKVKSEILLEEEVDDESGNQDSEAEKPISSKKKQTRSKQTPLPTEAHTPETINDTEQTEELPSEPEEEKIWESVEINPEFPGGTSALYQFLGEHMTYPQQVAEENIQGTVVVSFVVEKDGSVNHVKVARGRHSALDREAVRVVKMLPPFIPAQQNGYNVRVYYTLPIRFKLV